MREGSAGRRTFVRVAAVTGLTAGAAAAFVLDLPVAQFVRAHLAALAQRDVPQQVLEGLKGFAQVVPVVAIVWLIRRLDWPAGRQVAWRMLAAVILAGILCSATKTFVGRQRPEGFTGQTWRQTWLEWRFAPERRGRQESFFSGHTAAAFAMATVVGGAYPPARPVVFVLAGGCGLSRVIEQQHWASDVYVGGVAGAAVGWMFLPRRRGRRTGARVPHAILGERAVV